MDFPTTQASPVVVTIDEAAAQLRLSRSMIYKMIAARKLRTVMFGRSRRVPVAELQRITANAR